MASDRYATIVLNLGNATLDHMKKMSDIDEHDFTESLRPVKSLASEANREIKNALQEYELEKSKLEAYEINEIYHFRQIKTTRFFLDLTEKVMKLDDYNFTGFFTIMRKMEVELSKLKLQ